MSDSHCLHCNEPWDNYHLRHDALHETGHPNPKGWDGKLETVCGGVTAREWFKDDKWVFGDSLYDIRRCPCCPKGKGVLRQTIEEEDERAALRDELCSLMGGDEDGIAAMMEDFGL